MPDQPLIPPRTLKGFRDYPPEAMMPREAIMDTARRVYRSFGFAPIDTPALEHLEVLTGKGSDETDKQLFRFVDQGGREVGMRFDLTVPLARFAAQHAQQLGLPFKRYHLATVWRGEKPQVGRYREFMQCDFDTVGTESVVSDIETVLVVSELLTELNVGGFKIRLNHRGVLNGLLEKLDLADRSVAVLRALDKLDKIGPQKVAEELSKTAGASPQQCEALLNLAGLGGPNENMLAEAEKLVAGNEAGEAGAARLREVLAGCRAALPAARSEQLRFEPSIARGLDYYTGLVLETTLDALPAIGSVASGGRYDNLAGLYTKQRLPGIGASLGLDRLLAAMEELKLLPTHKTPAPVLVAYFVKDRLADYLQLAAAVRAAGVGAELYHEPKKLGKQLQYADKKGFRVALIAGEDELAADECKIKTLEDGGSVTAPLTEVPARLLELLQ